MRKKNNNDKKQFKAAEFNLDKVAGGYWGGYGGGGGWGGGYGGGGGWGGGYGGGGGWGGSYASWGGGGGWSNW